MTSVINQDIEARVFKLFKEKINSDVHLKRVVAARAASLHVVDNMIAEDLIFQLRTLLTAGDPKVTQENYVSSHCETPDLTCWNILKLAVKLLPGLPRSWKAKIHVQYHDMIGNTEVTIITRHLCPHYSFGSDVKHIEFLMGKNDTSENILF